MTTRAHSHRPPMAIEYGTSLPAALLGADVVCAVVVRQAHALLVARERVVGGTVAVACRLSRPRARGLGASWRPEAQRPARWREAGRRGRGEEGAERAEAREGGRRACAVRARLHGAAGGGGCAGAALRGAVSMARQAAARRGAVEEGAPLTRHRRRWTGSGARRPQQQRRSRCGCARAHRVRARASRPVSAPRLR